MELRPTRGQSKNDDDSISLSLLTKSPLCNTKINSNFLQPCFGNFKDRSLCYSPLCTISCVYFKASEYSPI